MTSEQSFSDITAVIFDWDMTLAYTKVGDNQFSTRLAAMFDIAGLPYTRDEIQAALDAHTRDAERGLVPPLAHVQTRREIGEQYIHLLKRLGYPDTSWPTLIRLYGTYAKLPTFLYDDSRAAIQSLRERGYHVGILSNHSTTARPVMEQFVGDLIPANQIVISEEEGVHKPAKTIFRRAAARMGVPPEQCALVGDNLQVDAIGSVERGGFGQGIWLDRREKGTNGALANSVTRITNLTQLPPLFD